MDRWRDLIRPRRSTRDWSSARVDRKVPKGRPKVRCQIRKGRKGKGRRLIWRRVSTRWRTRRMFGRRGEGQSERQPARIFRNRPIGVERQPARIFRNRPIGAERQPARIFLNRAIRRPQPHARPRQERRTGPRLQNEPEPKPRPKQKRNFLHPNP